MKACFNVIQQKSYNTQDYQRKDYVKTGWIINNNLNVRNAVLKINKSISKANSISSYDFVVRWRSW